MLRILMVILGCSVAAWFGGLVLFVVRLSGTPAVADRPTDAVVVLTGGSQRIERGVSRLVSGQAGKLYVSGVSQGTVPPEIQRLRRERPDLSACCVVLGHAENTVGNARETIDWIVGQHARSVRLVTADYHMPRALVEFRRILPPDVTIEPDPVHPEPAGLRRLFHWQTGWRILLIEYDKYLLAGLRAALDPPGGPAVRIAPPAT